MGGGIFTYTALVSAAKMVQESDKGTRHIVLFADAADAEEPGDYERLLATLTPLGITVSVIGLGSETDSDAAFLKDVAARGEGRIHFTASADELPRLFAQEAITVARSSFVDRADGRARAAGHGAARRVAGVTVSAASTATTSPTSGPARRWASSPRTNTRRPCWRSGIAASGRVASLTAEVDGQYSQRLNAWKDFPGVRRRPGPLAARRRSAVRRAGHASNATAARASSASSSIPVARAAAPTTCARRRRRSCRPARRRDRAAADAGVGRRRHARSALSASESRHVSRRRATGNRDVLPLAPLSLPYSPEFEPRPDPEEGRKTLTRSRASPAGIERTTWDDVFRPRAAQPSGARSDPAAHAVAARAARGRDRRSAAAAVRGGERVAAIAAPAAAFVMVATCPCRSRG